MGDGSGDGLFFSRARGVSEKLPARRRGLCQRGCWSLSLRSGSRVLLSERTGWNVDSNGRRMTLSSLARPRLDCCTRSQIRVGALRARTGPRGKFEVAVTLEDFDPQCVFPTREREAGRGRAVEVIGVGSGRGLTDLLRLDGGVEQPPDARSEQRQFESHGPVARPADGCV